MSNFIFTDTKIPDVKIIQPKVFGDNRGFFMETYKKDDFAQAGITCDFVQDNHSKSTKGVLRGLHFQTIHTQAKLVRATVGTIFDVAVDCRPNSVTFGQWVGEILSAENKTQLFVPEGFAHGFLVLSDEAEFIYKCSDTYTPSAEGGILWNDKDIGIQWPDLGGASILLSDKDKQHSTFHDQNFSFFERW